jgi:hypothetical protein
MVELFFRMSLKEKALGKGIEKVLVGSGVFDGNNIELSAGTNCHLLSATRHDGHRHTKTVACQFGGSDTSEFQGSLIQNEAKVLQGGNDGLDSLFFVGSVEIPGLHLPEFQRSFTVGIKDAFLGIDGTAAKQGKAKKERDDKVLFHIS